MNYRPTVRMGSDPKFCGNGLVFATQKEAQWSADRLMDRWTLVVETGTEETEAPVNMRVDWDSREQVSV